MNRRHMGWQLLVRTGIALLVLGAVAFGQEKQVPKRFATAGVIELGGSAMFQYSTPVVDGQTGDAGWMLVATPSVGYFVIDDLSIGAEPLGVAVDHHCRQHLHLVAVPRVRGLPLPHQQDVLPLRAGTGRLHGGDHLGERQPDDAGAASASAGASAGNSRSPTGG